MNIAFDINLYNTCLAKSRFFAPFVFLPRLILLIHTMVHSSNRTVHCMSILIAYYYYSRTVVERKSMYGY